MKILKNSEEKIDIVQLSASITEEEKKINDLYFQIGRLYSVLHNGDYEGVFGEFISSVNESKEKITDYLQQIKEFADAEKCNKINESSGSDISSEKREENTDTCIQTSETEKFGFEPKQEEPNESIDIYSKTPETESFDFEPKQKESDEGIDIYSKTPETESFDFEPKQRESDEGIDIYSKTPETESFDFEPKQEESDEDINIYSQTPETETENKNMEIDKDKTAYMDNYYEEDEEQEDDKELPDKNAVLPQEQSKYQEIPKKENNQPFIQQNTYQNTTAEYASQQPNFNNGNNFNGEFKFCQYCGQKLPVKSIFCSECGKRVMK